MTSPDTPAKQTGHTPGWLIAAYGGTFSFMCGGINASVNGIGPKAAMVGGVTCMVILGICHLFYWLGWRSLATGGSAKT